MSIHFDLAALSQANPLHFAALVVVTMLAAGGLLGCLAGATLARLGVQSSLRRAGELRRVNLVRAGQGEL